MHGYCLFIWFLEEYFVSYPLRTCPLFFAHGNTAFVQDSVFRASTKHLMVRLPWFQVKGPIYKQFKSFDTLDLASVRFRNRKRGLCTSSSTNLPWTEEGILYNLSGSPYTNQPMSIPESYNPNGNSTADGYLVRKRTIRKRGQERFCMMDKQPIGAFFY